MTQLPNKRNKKEEEKLIHLSRKFCKKMHSISNISPFFDMTILNDFNKYINDIYNFKDLFKISEFTKQINDIGESLKNIDHNFQIPSTNSPILSDKEINYIRNSIEKSNEDIDILREESKKLELNETNFGIVFIEKSGNFKYKNKFLKISIDSNNGKFLKYIIEDKDHFIPDEYCKKELNCPTPKEITYITRDMKKYLKKNELTAKLKRCRAKDGYLLEDICEIKS